MRNIGTSEIEMRSVLPNEWEKIKDSLIVLENMTFSPSIQDSPEVLKEILAHPGSIFLIAELSGEIIGNAFGGPIEAEIYSDIPGIKEFPHYGKGIVCYVESIAVHPSYQEKKLGAHLLSKFLENCKEKRFQFVAGHALEGPSHHLFTKAGSKIIRYHENWYNTGKKSYAFILPSSNDIQIVV